MAVAVVDSIERIPLGRRLLGAALRLAGWVLTLAGLLASSPLLVYPVACVLTVDVPDPRPLVQPPLLALYAGGALALFAGHRLRRGRRRSVLFLRRFGFTEASRAVSVAVGAALGRRWRVITLDDSQTERIGVSPISRRIARVSPWILAAIVVLIVGAGAHWLHGGPFERLADETFDSMRAQGENPFQAIVGAFVGTLLVMIVVGGIVLGLVLLGAAATGSLLGFALGTRRAIARAEALAAEIGAPEEVQPVVSGVTRKLGRIFAPRLLVVRVADPVWQAVVRAFEAHVAVVLVDVSVPSEAVLWELDLVQAPGGPPAVFVGREVDVRELAASRADEPLRERWRRVLEGERVLAYGDGADRAAIRRFARSLAAALDHAIREAAV